MDWAVPPRGATATNVRPEAQLSTCKLCGSRNLRPLYELTIEPVTVVECKDCTLRFVGDDLDPQLLEELYDQPHFAHYYSSFEERNETKFARRLAELSRLTNGAKGLSVLDVGCGRGDFCAAASAAGYDAFGIDISTTALEAARSRYPDGRFAVTTLGALTEAEERFDVVVLLDVIEHVLDPHAVIESAAAVLEPDGLLCLTTPNGASLYDVIAHSVYRVARRFGDPMLSQRYSQYHLQIWTKKTLTQLCAAHGLEAEWVSVQRELTAKPSLYAHQIGLGAVASALRVLDPLAEKVWPFRNKLVLYARRA